MTERGTSGGMEITSTVLLCPLCGWESAHRIAAVAAGKLDIHIRYGHTTDEVNGALDDGRVSEVNGKFGVGLNAGVDRQEKAT